MKYKTRKRKTRLTEHFTDVFGTAIDRKRKIQPVNFAKDIKVLEEPWLEFRYLQRLLDPRDGLSLFGPVDYEEKFHPESISYGVVGTPNGISFFNAFSKILHLPQVHDTKFVISEGRRITQKIKGAELDFQLKLWPPFPGFDVAFSCKLPETPTRTFAIDEGGLREASRHPNRFQRAYDVADIYLKGIESINRREEKIDVVVCVVPEDVFRFCRAKSVLKLDEVIEPDFSQDHEDPNRIEYGYDQGLVEEQDTSASEFSPDFRKQIKARLMVLGIHFPIQIIRETTLRPNDESEFGDRGLTPLSDRAWNISVGLYYKSGGKPWRLGTARAGVCYVGLVYKRTPESQESRTACCAAQMFLDSGDGVVFRSEFGPWYSPTDEEMHLSASEANSLLKRVLSTYDDQEGKRPLKEVFLHYLSPITDVEYEAFKAACPKDVKVVGVEVRPDRYGVHLYREGTRPVIRGTFWKVNEAQGYLWASGFKPRLAAYDGSETPVPLRIIIEHGEADIEQVAKDILGLTKLNYNECKYGDAQPVTISFSNLVGEILVSNPKIKEPERFFRFYI
jgi:hypothetical protein